MANPLETMVKYLPGFKDILVVVPSTETAGGAFAGQLAEIMSNNYSCKAIINEKFSSSLLNAHDLSALDINSDAFIEFLSPILKILGEYNDEKKNCILIILESLNAITYEKITTSCSNDRNQNEISAILVNGETFSDNSKKTVDLHSANISFDNNAFELNILHAIPNNLATERSFQDYFGDIPTELNQISTLDGYGSCKSFKLYFNDDRAHNHPTDDFASLIVEKCKNLLDSLNGNISPAFTVNSYVLHKSKRRAKNNHKTNPQTYQAKITISTQTSTQEEFEKELIYQETIVENANTVIELGLQQNLQNFISERFKSNHFEANTQTKLLNLVYSVENYGTSDNFDFRGAAHEYEYFDSMIDSLQKKDEAFYAYGSIMLGKILNSFKKTLKHQQSRLKTQTEKRKIQEEFDALLFKKKISSETKRYRMRIAEIPLVERWFFLGINRLIQLQPLVRNIKTTDPIGTLLGSSAYKFTLENSLNEDFGFIFKKYLNATTLSPIRDSISDAPLEKLTNAFPKTIPKEIQKKIINGVKSGVSFKGIVNTLIAKNNIQSPEGMTYTEPDLAPSWNLFDETCLKLQGIMEDILLNKVIPDYPPFITGAALLSLISLADDLKEFWKHNWEEFEL